jgi:hypothetical protein
MDREMAPLEEVLAKLPWWDDLSAPHRDELLNEVRAHLTDSTTREQYALLLESWGAIAHGDAKWSRLALMRERGLLAS